MGWAIAELPRFLARRRRTVEVEMHATGRKAPVDLVLDSTGLKFYGPGEWALKKHGEKRRDWRKLHIAMDAGTCEILAHELTNDDTSDPEMVTPLVENAGGHIRRVFADGAYDGRPTFDAIYDASPPKGEAHGGNQRELHGARIVEVGQMEWKKETEYGSRSLGEVAIGRVKSLTDGRLTARLLELRRP